MGMEEKDLCLRKDETSNSMDPGLQRATLEARRADRTVTGLQKRKDEQRLLQ